MVQDTFSASFKGPLIKLDASCCQASSFCLGHRWNTVYGTQAISSGKFAWHLRIDNVEKGGCPCPMVIGVARDRSKTDCLLSSVGVGFGYAATGRKVGGGS